MLLLHRLCIFLAFFGHVRNQSTGFSGRNCIKNSIISAQVISVTDPGSCLFSLFRVKVYKRLSPISFVCFLINITCISAPWKLLVLRTSEERTGGQRTPLDGWLPPSPTFFLKFNGLKKMTRKLRLTSGMMDVSCQQ